MIDGRIHPPGAPVRATQPVRIVRMTSTIEPRSAPVDLQVRNGHLVASITVGVVAQRDAQLAHDEISRALAAFEGKGRCFVLDLSRVSLLSSLGLGMCVDTRHRAIERGMKPLLCGLQPSLLDLLRMMKVDRLFTLVHGQAELARMIET
jgi:anti-anti-sigma factor